MPPTEPQQAEPEDVNEVEATDEDEPDVFDELLADFSDMENRYAKGGKNGVLARNLADDIIPALQRIVTVVRDELDAMTEEVAELAGERGSIIYSDVAEPIAGSLQLGDALADGILMLSQGKPVNMPGLVQTAQMYKQAAQAAREALAQALVEEPPADEAEGEEA
jgi:hypothetical protein